MAEFLIKAQTYTHADPEKDRRGVYKIGDIVDVRPDGFQWGNEERLPIFVVVKIPGLDPETVKDRMQSWHLKVQYTINSSTPSTDTHNITISATDFHAGTGEGKITRSAVEQWLTQWGAANIVVSDNAVTFDIRILDAIGSRNFWEMDTDGLVFTETSYTPSTGRHRIVVDYSAKAWTAAERDQAISVIQSMGAFVSQNPSAKTVTLNIARNDVRNKFQDDVQHKTERVLRRRKHHILESIVDQARTNGGVLTITTGDLVNKQAE